MSRILIACGGTGGHLAPGIAIAEMLQERGHVCVLLISQKQVDSALIEKYAHLTFHRAPGRAFAGGIVGKLASVGSLFSGMLFSRRLIREERPELVLLFGGFLSVGLGLVARLKRLPVAVHEANCSPGKAVRLISRYATRIYLPDDLVLKSARLERVRYFGYPVRKEIQALPKAEAQLQLGIPSAEKLLVVIGGSQGASALNDWALAQFERLAEQGISLYCVTGLGKTIEQRSYTNSQGKDLQATFVPFSDQMGAVISAADLVVSRAGAGSIAEIIRCRAPSILIPYPYAADNHQQANAEMHTKEGAGQLVLQAAIEELTEAVEALILDPDALARCRANLERIDTEDSEKLIAEDIEALVSAQKAGNDKESKSAI
jgi:UDP-N-acetylglucosamine--N-acetylmuramyl-(pentapeptide) pyrophosphoryl-undecaprenol N-acetylglucosamine transferase